MRNRPQVFDTTFIAHRQIVLNQIDRCNRIISDFASAPTAVDAKINQYDPMAMMQQGKTLALSIRILLSNARRALPKQFFERLRIENKFKKAYTKTRVTGKNGTIVSYKFLSADPCEQFEGILELTEFYDELLGAIFSIQEFSDLKFERANKEYEEDAEEEEVLFGLSD